MRFNSDKGYEKPFLHNHLISIQMLTDVDSQLQKMIFLKDYLF